MREFHAWPGITGLWILHSSFHLLPSSSRGRFAASQAVWGQYGGVTGLQGGDSLYHFGIAASSKPPRPKFRVGRSLFGIQPPQKYAWLLAGTAFLVAQRMAAESKPLFHPEVLRQQVRSSNLLVR